MLDDICWIVEPSLYRVAEEVLRAAAHEEESAGRPLGLPHHGSQAVHQCSGIHG